MKSELEQFKDELFIYNEGYETLYFKMKPMVNEAFEFLRGKIPFPESEESAAKLSLHNIKLSEIVATAGHNCRDAKNFYDKTKAGHVARLVEEKNIATEVALLEAETLMTEEFNLLNELEYNYDRADRLWKSTDTLILTLLRKPVYAKANSNTSNVSANTGTAYPSQ